MEYTYDELRQRISILEIAQANGYVFDRRKGARWPVLTHPNGDRVIVINPGNPARQGYFNPCDEGDKGTLIQFVARRLGWLFPRDSSREEAWNVNRVLHQWLRAPYRDRLFITKSSSPSRHGELVDSAPFNPGLLEPLGDASWLRSRGIDPDTLASPQFRARILQCRSGGHANVAFPYQQDLGGAFVGAELRNRNYKGHMAGSLRSRSLWHSQPGERVSRLMVFESALDALSHHELFPDRELVYASFGGHLAEGQLDCLERLLQALSQRGSVGLAIGVDADEKGDLYARLIRLRFPEAERLLPKGKDFNEMLMNMGSRRSPIL